ncbi:hypothetical protein [Gluconacetobacter johannae]|uniref:Uncharacterized protein n=1 Tax=Gluconacetobacter johannae TaxID=112140 RepID=A0A7W4J5D3_9PROT|nr:hypothetical protein [Gluconacetobacter johannae]MBB2175045.1 hypothetical protein [Gluconacetobacter johannae]
MAGGRGGVRPAAGRGGQRDDIPRIGRTDAKTLLWFYMYRARAARAGA